jgi:hypothetical protein
VEFKNQVCNSYLSGRSRALFQASPVAIAFSPPSCALSKKGGASRDLGDLRAAIDHHAAEGYHREIVKASLPAKRRAARQMADAQRCGQTDLHVLASSRNANEVASADGGREGADKQASAPTSCALYFVRHLQWNARGSYRSCISHSDTRLVLRPVFGEAFEFRSSFKVVGRCGSRCWKGWSGGAGRRTPRRGSSPGTGAR